MPATSTQRLPEPGYTRLCEVLKLLPVSKSWWYAGIASGAIQPGTKLGARTVAWDNAYLNELLAKLQSGEPLA